MTPDELLTLLKNDPAKVEFEQVMAVIADHYMYTPTSFSVGMGDGLVSNAAGSNEGSCRVFAFSGLHGLTPAQTLACFGRFYRDDVLGNPDGSDHANIRAFMRDGPDSLRFDGEALRGLAVG